VPLNESGILDALDVHAGDQASEHKTTGADDNDADGAALLREKS
jgi:hypothetical protein